MEIEFKKINKKRPGSKDSKIREAEDDHEDKDDDKNFKVIMHRQARRTRCKIHNWKLEKDSRGITKNST